MKETKTTYAYLIEHMTEPSFDKVRSIACDFVQKLPTELVEELHEMLNRGVDILDSEPLMQMYFYSYGCMHSEKLVFAFQNLNNYIKSASTIDLIDYGCGQGLATMCYHDFISNNCLQQKVRSITLIEPSSIALARAELLCACFFPEAVITAIQKPFDDLIASDIQVKGDVPTLHLFSNILDVESYDITHLSEMVKTSCKGNNEFVIVSPMQNERRLRRLKEFANQIRVNSYYEKFLDKQQLREDKDWTCAVLLCSDRSNSFEIDFNSIYDEAVSVFKKKKVDDKRVQELFHLLSIGALSGHAKCLNALGAFYKRGLGCEVNYSKSFECFELSANMDFSPAMVNLGTLYLRGKGTEIDAKEAFNLYSKAVQLNNLNAFPYLAKLYIEGKGCTKDENKAHELLIYAAERNDKTALRILGDCYSKGIGVELNIATAIDYYTQAGRNGDKKSILTLIDLFEEKDYKDLFLDQQFDVFVDAVRLGIDKISSITITWLNREPKGENDGVAVYCSQWLRLTKTICEYEERFGELHGIKKVQTYKIKEGTRLIHRDAFEDCKQLCMIDIPDTVNFIGERAFLNCIKLNEIHLPNSLVFIGDGAFDCDGHGLMGDRSEKRKLPLKVTIPSSVLMIAGNPFCCNSIISSNNERFKVIDNVLYSTDGKTLISFCSKKDEFFVPEGVTKIGVGAFRDNPIKKVHFPKTLEVIDKYAFDGAHNLGSVDFPESLREIREKAFDWCTFNTNYITLPSKVEVIDPEAFGFGWYIKLICVPKGRVTYYQSVLPNWVHNQICDEEIICASGLIMNKDKTEIIAATEVEDKIVVPEGIEVIRNQAFDSIYTIESIVFPRSLKNLSDKIFDDEATINHIYVPKGTKSFFSEKLSNFEEIIQEILDSDTI